MDVSCTLFRVQCTLLLSQQYRKRIHKRTISWRVLGIVLRVLRLEVSAYNIYITNQFQTTFAQKWGE
jgi:hypothetical protein